MVWERRLGREEVRTENHTPHTSSAIKQHKNRRCQQYAMAEATKTQKMRARDERRLCTETKTLLISHLSGMILSDNASTSYVAREGEGILHTDNATYLAVEETSEQMVRNGARIIVDKHPSCRQLLLSSFQRNTALSWHI